MNKLILPFFAGTLLVLAFAPIGYAIFSILSPCLLLYCILPSQPRLAAKQGFMFGLGYFVIGLYWLVQTVHQYGELPILLALFLTALLFAFLALYPALAVYLTCRWTSRINLRLLIFPFAWLTTELLRGTLLSGFPWLLLGYTQADSLLVGWLPIIGVYGVSFLLISISALIVYCLLAIQKLKFAPALLSSCFLTLLLWSAQPLSQINWTHPNGQRLQVSMIQANLQQSDKWSTEKLYHLLHTYKRLTSQHFNSDLIVWPETAIPYPFEDLKPHLLSLENNAIQHHSSILIGVPVKSKGSQYWNSLVSIGKTKAQYYKQKLVPFGEWLPFENQLQGLRRFFNIPISDFIAGPPDQTLFTFNNIPTAGFICYDIVYTTTVMQALPKAQLLITSSDDSWFGDSWALAQHFQIARARSLETGREQIVSTNTGITAIINSKGKVRVQAKPFTQTVLTAKAYAFEGSTPWMSVNKFFF